MNQKQIRNFSIIAHIDHGKSTLADKLMLSSGAVTNREMRDQLLDNMDIERERGITIKAQTVRIDYKALDKKDYIFNLIDTPGHVDFTYEVSRSLAACEGVLLVIDATQGIQAQTIANVNLAMQHDLFIIPVINKIDLPSADPDRVKEEIEDILQIEASEAILASAKEGIGIEDIKQAVVERIPFPQGDATKPLKALLCDAWYDMYRGAIILVRVKQGILKTGSKILMLATGQSYDVEEVGVFTPAPKVVQQLEPGEVGFVVAGIRQLDQTRIGDTVTLADAPTDQPLPGYKEVKPMVFSGLYPIDGVDFENLRDGLKKLKLNDASFSYEPETSAALGFGFRCGFLGLLHMDIVRERLEREFDLALLTTAPTVIYKVHTTDGDMVMLDNPVKLREISNLDHLEEPFIKGTIITPEEYVGTLMQIAIDRRGLQTKMEYLTPQTVRLEYEFPFNEIVLDFYDVLKSRTKGYASFDYEFIDFRSADLVKLDILFNGELVDALSTIVHKDKAYNRGRDLTKKLKEQVPRQMFELAIQAAIGGKIIARESIKALRKNVLAKCYGGDITRKRKLLEKQKAGKKKMKQIGKVEIPQEAFLAVLRTDVK